MPVTTRDRARWRARLTDRLYISDVEPDVNVVNGSVRIVTGSTAHAIIAGLAAGATVIVGGSVVYAGATGTGAMSGSSVGGSVAYAILTVMTDGDIAVVVVSGSVAHAMLSGTGALSGVSVGGSVTRGELGGMGSLELASVGGGSLSAQISGIGQVASVSCGGSLAIATLSAETGLSGVVLGTSIAQALLTGTGALSGASLGGSIARALLSGAGALSGVSLGGSTAYGAIDALATGPLIEDSFTATNGTSLNGRAPETGPSGETYTVHVGTVTIEGNRLRMNAGVGSATWSIESGSADVRHRRTINFNGNTYGIALTIRQSDANNFWMLYAFTTGLRIYDCQAGTFAQRDAVTFGTISDVADHELEFWVEGDDLFGKLTTNAAVEHAVDYSSSFNNSATRIGGYSDQPTTYTITDDLLVEAYP